MAENPHGAVPHNLMGILLEKESNHVLAMKHFRAAYALDPTLPKEIIIGCILRGDHSLIPRGDTSVKEGDILLMITSDKEKLNAVKELTKS